MAKKRSIDLFRAGEHTDSSGHKHTFDAATVAAIAAAYDYAAAPAPIVVGHPSTDAPAFGHADSLSFDAVTGKLRANLDMHDALEAAVTAKHYNKVSAAFFAPNHPSNPKPGQFYLRHVGFLGAAPPAVTGLAPFGFADAGKSGPILEIEFGTVDEPNGIVKLYQSLLGKKPADAIDGLSISLTPSFTAPSAITESTMNEAEKAELERLKTENTDLKTRFAALESGTVTNAANTFADGLVTAKKIDPARKPEIVATYLGLHKAGSVEFTAADGAKTTTSALDSWKKGFDAAKPVLNTAEKSPGDRTQENATKAHQFSAPAGVSVDSDSAELHNKTLAYMAKHGMEESDYAQALRVVQSEAGA